MPVTDSPAIVFALPDHLRAKADPRLIEADEAHFAAIAASLNESIADLTRRLADARLAPGGIGQEAMDRDLEVHRLAARLRTLRRYGVDLCLGHMVPSGGGAPVHIGRLGLTDAQGRRLLVDWRSPAAEPFFGATHAQPMGLDSRRRYRWVAGRIADYWDEAFTEAGLRGHAASLDDESAFLASLGGARTARMRDVLGTIQADQDAIIRSGSAGALVVDGGPGTGKTVVALHRIAYLLYSDPLLGDRRGGVLFVGPHQPYLDYVSDVLPSLGEEGVRTCTLRDLVPEGAGAAPEPDPNVARLKGDARLVAAIDAAVALYEEPPTKGLAVSTPWADVRLSPLDWAEAFAASEPGVPHNDARELIWAEILEILCDQHAELAEDDVPTEQVLDALRRNRGLVEALGRAWPLLEAADVVGDLWTVPAYLRRSAPWLAGDEVRALQRADAQRWTVEDLPLLDAARRRLGDPDAPRIRRERAARRAAERERMATVVDNLIDSDDSEMLVMSMLRGADAQNDLDEDGVLPDGTADALAGPFAHVVVDEAQELTDAQWQMLRGRCPSGSFTVVGDRAQARRGFAETWEQRLARVGIERVAVASLTINYRTPVEVMAEAEPAIRAAVPDANVPTSIRSSGVPVLRGALRDRDAILAAWRAAHPDGVACVIGDASFAPADPRMRSLTPELAKGLEFDLVIVVEPERFGAGIEGAVDRYVAMTRATRQLAVLTA